MAEEFFLRLQHSEGVVCQMASNLLAAFITAGQLTPDNENEFIDRSLKLAIKLAFKADRFIESDDESGEK